MDLNFESADISTLKAFFARPEHWASRNFSLSKNSFVLQDSASSRLVLYKGPAVFGGKLKNIGPLQLKLLRGELQLQQLKFEEHIVNHGTAKGYKTKGEIGVYSVSSGQSCQIDHWTAIDFNASADAIWLMQFEKSIQYATCVTFSAATAQAERVSLLYHSHSRMFNFIEVLARSTCARSLQALLNITHSPLDELAWRALEGLHHRDPLRAQQQMQHFAIQHSSVVVRNRSKILIEQSAVQGA